MLKKILNYQEPVSKQKTIVLSLLIAVIVLMADYITGQAVEFQLAYVFPVAVAAWFRQKSIAYAMALILPLVRIGFLCLWHETLSFSVVGLNALISVFSLLLYAYLIDRTAWQTSALEKKIKVLEGVLPICASCKRIRTETGNYQQLEEYITNRSEASFSHVICPECAKKLYPGYIKDVK